MGCPGPCSKRLFTLQGRVVLDVIYAVIRVDMSPIAIVPTPRLMGNSLCVSVASPRTMSYFLVPDEQHGRVLRIAKGYVPQRPSNDLDFVAALQPAPDDNPMIVATRCNQRINVLERVVLHILDTASQTDCDEHFRGPRNYVRADRCDM